VVNLGLVGLEAYIQSESGTNGNNDITLISGPITYAPVSNVRRRIVKSAGNSRCLLRSRTLVVDQHVIYKAADGTPLSE